MEIRFAIDQAEHRAATLLAESAYFARGYGQRLDALDADNGQVIVAIDHSTVIGTVSVVGGADTALPTTSYFGLRVAQVAAGLESRHVMEAGRLAIARTRHARASLCGLITAMTEWAQARGYQMGVLTLKPCIHRVITGKLGVGLKLLATPDALVPDRVPAASHGYFLPPDTTQRPSAYSIDLDAVRTAVDRMKSIVAGLFLS